MCVSGVFILYIFKEGNVVYSLYPIKKLKKKLHITVHT
jgi:hypothetical protein